MKQRCCSKRKPAPLYPNKRGLNHTASFENSPIWRPLPLSTTTTTKLSGEDLPNGTIIQSPLNSFAPSVQSEFLLMDDEDGDSAILSMASNPKQNGNCQLYLAEVKIVNGQRKESRPNVVVKPLGEPPLNLDVSITPV